MMRAATLLGARSAGAMRARPIGPPTRRGRAAWSGRGRLLAALLAVVSTACSLSQPAPVKNAFLLETERVADPGGSSFPGVLLVGDFDVAPSFAGRSMVYRFDEHRYEADFYNEF
ncbi:MAG TPA: hypothetical protein VFU53_07410, partial [Burkholderiales bacterium]|nr:hypothetical protein [Burkholderiales bacterium]